jgi:hypothetical protein
LLRENREKISPDVRCAGELFVRDSSSGRWCSPREGDGEMVERPGELDFRFGDRETVDGGLSSSLCGDGGESEISSRARPRATSDSGWLSVRLRCSFGLNGELE